VRKFSVENQDSSETFVEINPDKVLAHSYTATVTQPVTPAAVPGRGSYQSSREQIPCGTELGRLARRIRASRHAAQEAGAALLHHVLDAGDALNEAQEQVPTGWKRWLKDNCFLSVRTAFVYQRLAHHREEIETVLSQAGELSMRAALRLISKPTQEDGEEGPETGAPVNGSAAKELKSESANGSAAKELKPELVGVMAGMTDDELNKELPAALPFDRFLRILSQDWRNKIEARLSKRPHVQTAEAFIKASEIFRRARALVRTAATTGITPVVAASNEKEAIAALRQLNVVLAHVGVDEVTLVYQYAKEHRCAKQHRGARGRRRAA
jgi:hypothetical protein